MENYCLFCEFQLQGLVKTEQVLLRQRVCNICWEIVLKGHQEISDNNPAVPA
jgi:hypothetical protein